MAWVLTVDHPALGQGAFVLETLLDAVDKCVRLRVKALDGAPGLFHATIDETE